MKLSNQTLRQYYIFSILVFIISIPVLYYLTQNLWKEDIDETLVIQRDLIIKNIQNQEIDSLLLLHFTEISDKLEIGIHIELVNDSLSLSNNYFDLTYYDSTHQHVEPFRNLNSVFEANGKKYLATISRDMVESEDLISGIVLAQVILYAALLLGILLLTKYFSKRNWKSFYFLLERLETYKIDSNKQIVVLPSKIDEFNELNRALINLSKKNGDIYRAQKEFTENASHEMQTPLAVLKGQLELLSQDAEVSKAHAEKIHRMESNIRHMTKLNRSLLLLSRIDNKQFEITTNVVVNKELNVLLEDLEDQLEYRGIKVNKKNSELITLDVNPHLIKSLLGNLLTNAIKHNINEGSIDIETSAQELTISNTGKTEPLLVEKIFNRFYKEDEDVANNGLGLAIVKRICQSNGYTISYAFSSPNKHCFRVKFKN